MSVHSWAIWLSAFLAGKAVVSMAVDGRRGRWGSKGGSQTTRGGDGQEDGGHGGHGCHGCRPDGDAAPCQACGP